MKILEHKTKDIEFGEIFLSFFVLPLYLGVSLV